MRYSWRLMLLRNYSRSTLQNPTHFSCFQVYSSSLRSLSTLLRTHSPSQFDNLANGIVPINPYAQLRYKDFVARNFSSEAAIEEEGHTDHVVVVEAFSKFSDSDDIKRELNGVVFTHDMVLRVLKSFESSPDVATRFFDWVVERDGERLSSKSYNLMLDILGLNGFVEEFWNLVQTMKKKGYGVSKGVHDKVLDKFEKDGLVNDAERLKGVFSTGSVDNSMEKIGLRLYRIIRNEVWGDEVEQRIKDLDVTFSSDLVKMVLENLGTEPMKALIFFRWIDESGLFKHDEKSYNAMARVLGREDCLDRFWKVVDEMRSGGFEMEMETYVKVLGRFAKRKMIKDAVDLYEFAMAGASKPSANCCTFLLRKIVAGKQLDMNLFSKVVSVFKQSGGILTDPMLDAVLKSLTSVGRIQEFTKVFKAMGEGGFVPTGNLQGKIAYRLSCARQKEETNRFVDHMETLGRGLDGRAWVSLVEGHCVAGDLEKASEYFQKMLQKEGASGVSYTFELLVNAYCNKNRAIDACKLLCNFVSENQLKPWHTTYKALINKLLVQKGFSEALNILTLMKNHGFPPEVDPFIEYISKTGTADDAIAFLKAMTSKRFPSTSVVIRMFEAILQSGKHHKAQDILSKCPNYIRNHADVLNLFCSMKSAKRTTAAALAV
ncbi:pentatricopeptide repeat-containing protein [Tripterygium wilfordii]|uniref:Pentatricopeptide repeat-containing protein n=1 Tax=Tripterygium wilfordii TaxID=458696 RepID=A0A7J7CP10_TRIWF|nr:pentatricopeptide repeat-containing protein At3g02490, mitochondrial [Tripterygium wilfordii]KAF5735646.1 pentatricopeptide repeat-containing protein [Tripterygium wilfordii]